MKTRSKVEGIFERARSSLLMVVVFSVFNLFLNIFNAKIFFLFSVTFPMIVLELGGFLAEEGYGQTAVIVTFAVAFAMVALYFGCYLLSDKLKGFVVVALAMFSFDTLFLLLLVIFQPEASVIIDLAFHILVIYYLAVGIKAWLDLKKLPPEEPAESIEPMCGTVQP